MIKLLKLLFGYDNVESHADRWFTGEQKLMELNPDVPVSGEGTIDNPYIIHDDVGDHTIFAKGSGNNIICVDQ